MSHIAIIASSVQHFEHICHMYRLEKNDVVYIHEARKLQTIRPECILLWGDQWWRDKSNEEVDRMEQYGKFHRESRDKVVKPW